jgi:hypothetical protein
MTDEKTADFLAQEYLFLQKTVEEFDGRALTIKAWSVTFSAAGLGFAYQQKNAILLLVAAGSALVFWIVETVWKYNQRAYYPRIFKIERWFAEQSAAGSAEPFQMTTQWKNEFAGWTAKWIYAEADAPWWKSLGVPFFVGVMMPHVVIFATGVLLYFLAPPV